MTMMATLQTLPPELVADILSELDLKTLITISHLSRRLLDIVSDSSLNPWRRPILRNLRAGDYEPCLANLSVRWSVPRHNWIEILSLATPHFLLYETTLPNLKPDQWQEAFDRRFLPGWQRWKRECSWKEAFLKMLTRVYHRTSTSCTAEESWTKYIVLNRNGSANELEASSRTFSPLAIFNEMKLQNNLAHIATRIRLIVELTDVRIIALGVLDRPRSTLTMNWNAHAILRPPGITREGINTQIPRWSDFVSDHGVYPIGSEAATNAQIAFSVPPNTYTRLNHPLPAPSHANYPWYTPGGQDKRWEELDEEEERFRWVGGLMLVAQFVGPTTHEVTGDIPLQDMDLVVGPGRQQYASFTWSDLWALAPWMEEKISKKIDGPGLGI